MLQELGAELFGRTTHMLMNSEIQQEEWNKHVFKEYREWAVFLYLREDCIWPAYNFI